MATQVKLMEELIPSGVIKNSTTATRSLFWASTIDEFERSETITTQLSRDEALLVLMALYYAQTRFGIALKEVSLKTIRRNIAVAEQRWRFAFMLDKSGSGDLFETANEIYPIIVDTSCAVNGTWDRHAANLK